VYDRHVGNRRSLLLWLGLSGVTAGCGNLLGISDLGGPGDASGPGGDDATDAAPLLPPCKAQRLVHMVGGNGGLAWFTLAWPIPSMIQNFNATFAYDDPTKAIAQGMDPLHPLFARNNLWAQHGKSPFATVFLAGLNETHTQTPSSNAISNQIGLDAAATVVQAPFASTFPAVVIGATGPFGTAMGAATPVAVNNSSGYISVLLSAGIGTDADIRPSAAQLGRYLPPNPLTNETEIATILAATANAYKLNLVADVMLPAFSDDPHGAFADGSAPGRANDLAQMLDAFYADLQAANEPSCGDADGKPLSFADNTVLYVTGDTPKAFSISGGNWGDGTTGNTNQVFLRSNGFIKPGWFGVIDVEANAHTNFDVTTGAPSAAGPVDPMDTAAGWASTLYAVARGDATKVSTFTPAIFDGEKLP
jgi:hypothetical protein